MNKMMEKTIGLLVMAGATSVWATNGMDLEGYGPRAQAMGGVSIAIDNGTAAVINNPATLSLIPEGGQQIDVAIGVLGPDVRASVPGAPEAKSNGDSYLMPAFGWAKREGSLVYGIGIFGQGGMGTDYSEKSFLALNSGNEVRSEISVGRLIAPLAYDVTDKLSIGGTLDLVWAGMDLRMAMTAPQAMSMLSGMPTLPLPALSQSDWVRVDFSDGSPFVGEAKGLGGSAKIGALYSVNDKLRVGALYHHKTELGDMKSEEASLSFGSSATGQQYGKMPGTVTIEDFAWPALVGAGLAFEATERLTLALDVRHIFWEDVMKSMDMTFKGDGGAGHINMSLPQNWDDQTVYQVGAAFQATDTVVLRAGYNYGKNPVPDELVNPLFPAIIEHHITGGIGLAVAEGQSVDFSVVYAPETEVTNASGVTSTHSQLNAQLMYSYRF